MINAFQLIFYLFFSCLLLAEYFRQNFLTTASLLLSQHIFSFRFCFLFLTQLVFCSVAKNWKLKAGSWPLSSCAVSTKSHTHKLTNGQNAVFNNSAKVDLLLWGSLCLWLISRSFYLNRNLS